MGDIVRKGDDHRQIVRWLWTILLADGIRALCRAGRWPEALHRAQQHNGLGHRLFDGRQVAIIASATAAMVDAYLALDPVPGHAVFHIRLGLPVADLAHDSHDIQPVIRVIERSALDAADAYSARDARTDRTPSPLSEAAAHALTKTERQASAPRCPHDCWTTSCNPPIGAKPFSPGLDDHRFPNLQIARCHIKK